jgi:hypothetical protein
MVAAVQIQTRTLAFSGPVIASGLVGLLLFAEIMLYGANTTDLALGFSGLWFAALALLLTQAWARDALAQIRLGWIGLVFVGVLLAGVLSLSPWAIGGPHPVWTWVADAMPTASIDPYLTQVELVKLAALAAIFLIGSIFGADDERAKSLIRWILGLGLAYSFWAFIDWVSNPGELYGAARSFDPSRLSVSLVSANTAATLFGALTLLNLIDLDRTFQHHRPGARVDTRRVDAHRAAPPRMDIRRLERLAPKIALPLVSLAAAATCLILTLSRGGLLATAAIVIILIGGAGIARARRGALSAVALATISVLAGIILGSFALNLGSLQDRLSFLDNDAVIRTTIFAAHWAAFYASPASGYGLGSFAHVNAMITNQTNLSALGLLGAAHNVYLQWLEQAGLVGTLPMFACIGLITLKIARGAVRRRRMRSWLVAVLAILALFLIHGASDFALEVPAMAGLLSLLLGIGCGAAGEGARAVVFVSSVQKPRSAWARKSFRRDGAERRLDEMDEGGQYN